MPSAGVSAEATEMSHGFNVRWSSPFCDGDSGVAFTSMTGAGAGAGRGAETSAAGTTTLAVTPSLSFDDSSTVIPWVLARWPIT